MKVQHIVGNGASQSASQVTSFVNGGYNRGGIDAYVITRGGGPYTDFSTPIFQLNEETALQVTQPDNPHYRLWEEAGTAPAPDLWGGPVRAWGPRRRTGPAGAPPPDTALP